MPVRKIRRSYGLNLTGSFTTAKGSVPHRFESKLELQLLFLLAVDPRVESFEAQPLHVPMGEGSRHYTPDFLVHFRQDPRFGPPLPPWLIEVKYHQDLEADEGDLARKFEAATNFAQDPERGWEFKVLTEREISTPCMWNARFLMANMHANPHPALVDSLVMELQTRQECEVLDLIAPNATEAERMDCLAAIWWLVLHRRIWADLGKPFVRQRRRPKVMVRWIPPGATPDPFFCWSQDGPPMAATYFSSLVPNPALRVNTPGASQQGVLDLRRGARFLCGDKTVTIKDHSEDLTHAFVQEKGTKRLDKVPIAPGQAPMLRSVPSSNGGFAHAYDPLQVPLEAHTTAVKRAEVIAPLLTGRFTIDEMRAHALRLDINLSTIYRWRKKYREGGQVPYALLPQTSNGGEGKGRVGQDREAILDEFITGKFLRRDPKLSVTQVWDLMREECEERGLKTPCLNTLRARIAALDPYEVSKARDGYFVAREAHHMDKGRFPLADYPLAVVQIDMTQDDLIIVDDESRFPIGRPRVTHAVDAFSSAVVGLSLLIEAPGAQGTGQCIYQAVMPKGPLLEKLGIEGTWYCSGMPAAIHLDNALDYTGNMIQRVGESWGINVLHRPVRLAWYGGHVESFHDILADALHSLPGTTYGSPSERGDYDSVGSAVIAKSEFERWLYRFVVAYNHKPKRGLGGMSPHARFMEGIRGSEWVQGRGAVKYPEDPAKFRVDLLPYFETTIQDYGIDIEGIRFQNAKALREFRNVTDITSPLKSRKPKYMFRVDRNDASVVYFWNPNIRQYVPIPAIDAAELEGVSWAEVRAMRRRLRQQSDSNPDQAQIGRLAKENRDEVELASRRTKKGRNSLARDHQRRVDAAKESKAIRDLVPEPAAPPPAPANVHPLRTRPRKAAVLEAEGT